MYLWRQREQGNVVLVPGGEVWSGHETEGNEALT